MRILLAIALLLSVQGCATNGHQPAYVKYLKYRPMTEYYKERYYRRANR